MLSFQHHDLHNIKKLGLIARKVCVFSSVLIIQSRISINSSDFFDVLQLSEVELKSKTKPVFALDRVQSEYEQHTHFHSIRWRRSSE
jgi:hypothetical protein